MTPRNTRSLFLRLFKISPMSFYRRKRIVFHSSSSGKDSKVFRIVTHRNRGGRRRGARRRGGARDGVEARELERGAVSAVDAVVRVASLEHAFALRRGHQLARLRVDVLPSIFRAVEAEGLPYQTVRVRRGEGLIQGADGHVDAARHAGNLVVNVISSEGYIEAAGAYRRRGHLYARARRAALGARVRAEGELVVLAETLEQAPRPELVVEVGRVEGDVEEFAARQARDDGSPFEEGAVHLELAAVQLE